MAGFASPGRYEHLRAAREPTDLDAVTRAGSAGLAMVGAIAWFLAPFVIAFGVWPYNQDAGLAAILMAINLAPMGMLAGVITGLWPDAAPRGRRRTRYAAAALLLVGLPLVGLALLWGPAGAPCLRC
jgi:hypothetical protein